MEFRNRDTGGILPQSGRRDKSTRRGKRGRRQIFAAFRDNSENLEEFIRREFHKGNVVDTSNWLLRIE
jgi:hypothetical protein